MESRRAGVEHTKRCNVCKEWTWSGPFRMPLIQRRMSFCSMLGYRTWTSGPNSFINKIPDGEQCLQICRNYYCSRESNHTSRLLEGLFAMRNARDSLVAASQQRPAPH